MKTGKWAVLTTLTIVAAVGIFLATGQRQSEAQSKTEHSANAFRY